MIKCSRCGAESDAGAALCPRCGADLPRTKPKKYSTIDGAPRARPRPAAPPPPERPVPERRPAAKAKVSLPKVYPPKGGWGAPPSKSKTFMGYPGQLAKIKTGKASGPAAGVEIAPGAEDSQDAGIEIAPGAEDSQDAGIVIEPPRASSASPTPRPSPAAAPPPSSPPAQPGPNLVIFGEDETAPDPGPTPAAAPQPALAPPQGGWAWSDSGQASAPEPEPEPEFDMGETVADAVAHFDYRPGQLNFDPLPTGALSPEPEAAPQPAPSPAPPAASPLPPVGGKLDLPAPVSAPSQPVAVQPAAPQPAAPTQATPPADQEELARREEAVRAAAGRRTSSRSSYIEAHQRGFRRDARQAGQPRSSRGVAWIALLLGLALVGFAVYLLVSR